MIDSIRCVKKNHSFPTVEFEILECPRAYHQSTFTMESKNEAARIMGRLGPRSNIRGGCGVYSAEVTALLSHVKLYWTSDYKWYSNRILDIEVAHDVKNLMAERNLSAEELIAFL
jgi:hypothetical protein